MSHSTSSSGLNGDGKDTARRKPAHTSFWARSEVEDRSVLLPDLKDLPETKSTTGNFHSDHPGRVFQDRVAKHQRHEDEENAVLETMAEALSRLRGEAQEINTDLQEQNVLIHELDENTTRIDLAFQLVARKVDNLLQKTGLPYTQIIITQCVMIILMFILIVYF